jgi:hypothetical protein
MTRESLLGSMNAGCSAPRGAGAAVVDRRGQGNESGVRPTSASAAIVCRSMTFRSTLQPRRWPSSPTTSSGLYGARSRGRARRPSTVSNRSHRHRRHRSTHSDRDAAAGQVFSISRVMLAAWKRRPARIQPESDRASRCWARCRIPACPRQLRGSDQARSALCYRILRTVNSAALRCVRP